MKKTLLNLSMLLLFMIVGLGSAWAEAQYETLAFSSTTNSVVITSAGQGEPGGDVKASQGIVTVTSAGGQLQANKALQIYKTKSMTVSVPKTYVITSIDFTYPSSCYPFAEAIPDGLTNATTKTTATSIATYKTSTSTSSITFTNIAGGQTKVNKMTVYYKSSGEEDSDEEVYNINIDKNIVGGSVSADLTTAKENTEVTLSITPNQGYSFSSLSVKDADNKDVSVNNYKFTMPASNVVVSATFEPVSQNENEIAVTYNFNDKDAYPNGFPTSGTNVAQAKTFKISGNDIVINAPTSYYIINNTTSNCGLFFGKTTATNGTPTDGTAYLGFPAKEGYKLTKVSVTTTATVAGSVKMNIYDASWKAMSAELSTTASKKLTFEFSLTSSVVNTEYRLASGSSGKNLQFDNIVLIYEEVDPVFTLQTLSLNAKDNDGYWATFSSDKVTFFPNDVTVNTVVVDDGTVTLLAGEDGVFEKGDVTIGEEEVEGYYVPAKTGVLVYSVENSATYYEVENKSVEEVDEELNMLRPASEKMEGDYKFYKLSYKSENLDALGFYYGKAGGVAFEMTNKNGAYLAVPSSSAGNVKAFVLAEGSTGIDAVAAKIDANAQIYNVAGQRVSSVTKGLYIQNGKKVFVK